MKTIKTEITIEIYEKDENWPMLFSQHIGSGHVGEPGGDDEVQFSLAVSGSTFIVTFDETEAVAGQRHTYVKVDAAIRAAIKEALKP